MSMDDARNDSTTESTVCWGAWEIGKAINRTERQAFHLLKLKQIKSARKVGGIWTAGRAALLREFGGEAGPGILRQARKRVGAWRLSPLPSLTRCIARPRRRGRSRCEV